MSISYALISRSNTPLCQFCNEPGNFDLYYQKFLSSHETVEGKVVIYKYDNMSWGILREASMLTILCVVHLECDDSSIERLLYEIKSRFLRLHGSSWQNAPTFSLQSSFQPQLCDIINRFQALPSQNEFNQHLYDPVQRDSEPLIQSDVTMTSQQSIQIFHCSKRIKFISTIILIILLLTYIILIFLCDGFALSGCMKK